MDAAYSWEEFSNDFWSAMAIYAKHKKKIEDSGVIEGTFDAQQLIRDLVAIFHGRFLSQDEIANRVESLTRSTAAYLSAGHLLGEYLHISFPRYEGERRVSGSAIRAVYELVVVEGMIQPTAQQVVDRANRIAKEAGTPEGQPPI